MTGIYRVRNWQAFQAGAIGNVLRQRNYQNDRRAEKKRPLQPIDAPYTMEKILVAREFDDRFTAFALKVGKRNADAYWLRVLQHAGTSTGLVGRVRATEDTFGPIVLTRSWDYVSASAGRAVFREMVACGMLVEDVTACVICGVIDTCTCNASANVSDMRALAQAQDQVPTLSEGTPAVSGPPPIETARERAPGTRISDPETVEDWELVWGVVSQWARIETGKRDAEFGEDARRMVADNRRQKLRKPPGPDRAVPWHDREALARNRDWIEARDPGALLRIAASNGRHE